MKYDDVIRKIRACLALASSPVHAAGATQEAANSGFKSDPPAYAVILSGMIGRAFQCDRLSLRAGKTARIQHGLNGAAPIAALPGGGGK